MNCNSAGWLIPCDPQWLDCAYRPHSDESSREPIFLNGHWQWMLADFPHSWRPIDLEQKEVQTVCSTVPKESSWFIIVVYFTKDNQKLPKNGVEHQLVILERDEGRVSREAASWVLASRTPFNAFLVDLAQLELRYHDTRVISAQLMFLRKLMD